MTTREQALAAALREIAEACGKAMKAANRAASEWNELGAAVMAVVGLQTIEAIAERALAEREGGQQ